MRKTYEQRARDRAWALARKLDPRLGAKNRLDFRGSLDVLWDAIEKYTRDCSGLIGPREVSWGIALASFGTPTPQPRGELPNLMIQVWHLARAHRAHLATCAAVWELADVAAAVPGTDAHCKALCSADAAICAEDQYWMEAQCPEAGAATRREREEMWESWERAKKEVRP